MELTKLDTNQIPKYTFDEKYGANRVIVVGSDIGQILKEQVAESLSNIRVNILPTETKVEPQIRIEYKEIEKPVIITEQKIEIREIEKPIIVKEIEIREVEKQVIIKQIEYKEIEKPVIIQQEKFIDLPNTIKIFMGIQSLIILGLLIKLIIQ